MKHLESGLAHSEFPGPLATVAEGGEYLLKSKLFSLSMLTFLSFLAAFSEEPCLNFPFPLMLATVLTSLAARSWLWVFPGLHLHTSVGVHLPSLGS